MGVPGGETGAGAQYERKTLLKRTGDGTDFLGYRLFYHHWLLRRKSMYKVRMRLARMARRYTRGELNQANVQSILAGWLGDTRSSESKTFADGNSPDFA